MKHLGKDSRMKHINRLCAFISADIKSGGKRGDNSQNVFLEQNFIDIYNIAFGANFKKCEKINQPGIDIIDSNKKIGVQITSEITSNKIYHTFHQYFKHSESIDITKLKFFFLSENLSKLTDISITKIEDYLNKEPILSNINKGKAKKFTKIEINKNLFEIDKDILCFDFINDNYHELDNDILNKIIKVLEDVLPFVKITTDDFASYISNKKLVSLNEKLDSLPKLEGIKLIINTFLPLKIIPYHILTGLNYAGKRMGSTVHIHTLTTDNNDLFEDVSKEKSGDGSKPLINFLVRNKIQTVHLLRSSRKINLTLSYDKPTTCSICNYNSFNLDVTFLYDTPDKIVTIENLETSFYKAYFFAEYGKYSQSIEQLHAIWAFSQFNQNYHIAGFLALYNLRRLQTSFYLRFNDRSIINNLPAEVLKELNRDFSVLVSDSISKEEQDVIDYYYHFKHINNQFLALDLVKETEKAIRVDTNGGYYSKKLHLDWYMLTTNAVDVTAHNMLLFETKFSEISQIVHKSFQSVLALSLLRHEKSTKPHLWSTFITYTIIILSESELKECLLNYRKKSPLLTSKENLKTIDTILTKIISNIHLCHNAVSAYLSIKPDNLFSLTDNINQAFQNVCFYYTYLNLDDYGLNDNLSKMLDLVDSPILLKPYNLDSLISLINEKQKVLSAANCLKIKQIYEKYPGAFLGLELYHSAFIDLHDFDYRNNTIETLLDLWIYRNEEVDQQELKTVFKDFLTENYNFITLRNAVINDLIKFDEFKDKTIEYLKDIIQDTYDFFLNEWVILHFIEIAYHENLDLSLSEYQELLPKKSKQLDYYTWLFNVKSYNYDDFVPYWLLKNPYNPFLKKFKTIPQIKVKLVEYLKSNEDAKLSQLYFAHFIDS